MNSIYHAKLEYWATSIIEMVKSRRTVEDARVELKRDWIDPVKAARRLAGHANAARGAEVAWIVGLDEREGVLGSNPRELSTWWPQVQACFDGPSPSLTDLVIHVDDKTVCFLCFSSDRAPFVIKNPKFGSAEAGAISMEVPWREGTQVRSATRSDLICLLTPVATIPDAEVLDAHLSVRTSRGDFDDKEPCESVYLSLVVYLTPRGDGSTVIPFHRCTCEISNKGGSRSISGLKVNISRASPYAIGGGGRINGAAMECTSSELIAHGPGQCLVVGQIDIEDVPSWLLDGDLKVVARLSVIDACAPVVIEVLLSADPNSRAGALHWNLVRSE